MTDKLTVFWYGIGIVFFALFVAGLTYVFAPYVNVEIPFQKDSYPISTEAEGNVLGTCWLEVVTPGDYTKTAKVVNLSTRTTNYCEILQRTCNENKTDGMCVWIEAEEPICYCS